MKWLDSTNYRDTIAAGKGKLEWERKIPDEQINDLKVLLEADNFNDNLPAVSFNLQNILPILADPLNFTTGYQQDQPALLQDVQ